MISANLIPAHSGGLGERGSDQRLWLASSRRPPVDRCAGRCAERWRQPGLPDGGEIFCREPCQTFRVMRAVVYDRYGPPEVLRVVEAERPAPGDHELLVRVHASTVNRLDCHTREANRGNGLVISGVSRLVSGIRRPRQRILGTEFAGEVEAAGPAVTRFAAGHRVFGTTGLGFGCHAEFSCIP